MQDVWRTSFGSARMSKVTPHLWVEVPGRAADVLGDVGVDVLAVLVHGGGLGAGLPRLLQLLRLPVVIAVLLRRTWEVTWLGGYFNDIHFKFTI